MGGTTGAGWVVVVVDGEVDDVLELVVDVLEGVVVAVEQAPRNTAETK